MSVELKRRLFTVEEYHAMARAGVFDGDDRVELIEGEIVEVAAIGSRHAACVKRLNRQFSQRIGEQALLGVQDPVRLSDLSEPEPDLSLLRPREDFYAGSHPTPDDVLLLVEVADASLGTDRQEDPSLCPGRRPRGVAGGPGRRLETGLRGGLPVADAGRIRRRPES